MPINYIILHFLRLSSPLLVTLFFGYGVALISHEDSVDITNAKAGTPQFIDTIENHVKGFGIMGSEYVVHEETGFKVNAAASFYNRFAWNSKTYKRSNIFEALKNLSGRTELCILYGRSRAG